MGFFNRSKELKQKELELQKMEEALQYKESELNARTENLENAKASFETHKNQIGDKLLSREDEISRRETELNNAEADFEPKRREAESGFAKRLSETDREIQEKITAHSEAILAQQKEFAEKQHQRHQQMEKELEDKLLEQTNTRVAQTDAELLERRNNLAEKETQLRNQEQHLKDEREQFAQEQRAHETQKDLLEAQKQNVLSKEKSLDEKAAELADAKVRELNARLENYKEQHERLSHERADLETQLEAFKDIQNRLNGEQPEILLEKLQSLQRQVSDLKTRLAEMPEDVLQEISQKNSEINTLTAERENLNNELTKVKVALSATEQSRIDISSLQAKIHTLSQDNSLLDTECARLTEAVKKYRDLYDKQATLEEKIQTIMAPHEKFTEDKIRKENLFSKNDEATIDEESEDSDDDFDPEDESSEGAVKEADSGSDNDTIATAEQEQKWLENVSKKISEYGLEFSPRILKAFHTALKTAEWSPLAVLAGVSGTGKSELPQLYAKFGGINFINIPVQPNWDSQEAMLGYYNTVSSKFEAQPLLQFLVQTQTENSDTYRCSLKEQMNIVLLDEMNLAHIEQYFAEFLSKLEERRGKKESNPDFPSLSVKLGGTDSYPLKLGRNVLWVGTMNQDETTKSLSDKVLDRGIVISFPRPDEFKRRLNLNKDVSAESKYLSAEIWNSWKLVLSDEEIEATEKIIAPYKNLVEKINKTISNIGRAIGHRVWQSIENYIWNYPDVRKMYLSRPADMSDEDFIKEISKQIDPAFEDQLVQKIMPKLRGIETRGESKKCLEDIRNSIESFRGEGHALNIVKDFDNAIKFGDGQFLWVTSEYLNKASAE